jgi:hypothetical protein
MKKQKSHAVFFCCKITVLNLPPRSAAVKNEGAARSPLPPCQLFRPELEYFPLLCWIERQEPMVHLPPVTRITRCGRSIFL